jgi:hypothetical protein
MAYDSKRDRLVLFGGDRNENQIVGETWEWDGTAWSKFTEPGPESRLPGSMSYDETRQKIVLYGGLHFEQNFKRTDYNDTWEFDGNGWTKQYDGTGQLKTKIHPDLSFNPVNHKVWLIGGSIDGSSQNETWEWTGSEWIQLSQGSMPTARSGLSMAYDTKMNRLVLHGGFAVPGGKPENDTWVFENGKWSCVNNCN